MRASDIFEILFFISIFVYPIIVLFKKKESLEKKISKLKHTYPNFFDKFPDLENSNKIEDIETQVLRIGKLIRENKNYEIYKPAYIEISKIIFNY